MLKVSSPHLPSVQPKNIFLNKLLLLCFLFPLCTCNDTLTPSESLTNGDVLVSSGKNYALGLFNRGNSTYLGIWFNKIPKQIVVWVANRDSPIKNNSSGVLKINSQGNIIILDKETNTTLWSTNSPITTGNSNSIAKLLDSGNLVLIRNDSKNFVWQSFDYPTDSLLPGMKLGLRPRLGSNWSLTSWKSSDDPGNGYYSLFIDSRGSPQKFMHKGLVPLWRGGPWNGVRLSAMPEIFFPELFSYRFVNTPDEISFMFVATNISIFSRFVMNYTGAYELQIWQNHRWDTLSSTTRQTCNIYASCGAYGSCGNNYLIRCTCLPGFEPRFPQDWNLGIGSGGCVRKRPAQYCGKGDGFLKKSNVKVPDTSVARVDMSLSLEECQQKCLRNCNCTAYTAADIRGEGSGCLAWYGDLIDIMEFASGGQDLFFRVDATELETAANASRNSKGFHGKKKKKLIIVLPFLLGGLFLLVICGCCFVRKRRKGKGNRGGAHQGVSLFNFPSISTRLNDPASAMELEETTTPELPFFTLNIIIAATDNFSPTNKLGQGGFGPVYKGQLSNGQEIAIKRLSKSSGQGIEEFKNEVMLITKLQHRNLVKILGCCIHNEEKMLIYEYMPNKSLDYFIFDKTRRASLDWSNRAKIIVGIARGLLYLHQDSRLTIIHRDLKPSNILLDANMNPKISDFGIARIFGGDHTQENTRRVVGTYGYMSPEYAIDGLFSVKSDVFSFGVLLLEIISGKRSNGYYLEGTDMSLIAYVWRHWQEDIALDIVDSCLGEAYPSHEVLRCIQVGLLCLQESASDRPIMSNVVFMLATETNLPLPKRPAFVLNRTRDDANSSATGTSGSINDVTITTTKAR